MTNSRKKIVYVLIGNEPFDACMERIRLELDNGAEPYCQPADEAQRAGEASVGAIRLDGATTQ
ncbi:MAG: hypothetical protein OXL97_11750 [Chloroflexota bacterium]|nr:hypothetical protein [Chloroflexota bacterium]MDE2884648.1 hypothetical protein [Chloroflexota bacterium]